MSEFIRYQAGEDGWSDWVQPAMSGYRLKCCGCRLVHEVEFVALRVVAEHGDGVIESVPLKPEKFKVGFRMKAADGDESQSTLTPDELREENERLKAELTRVRDNHRVYHRRAQKAESRFNQIGNHLDYMRFHLRHLLVKDFPTHRFPERGAVDESEALIDIAYKLLERKLWLQQQYEQLKAEKEAKCQPK